MCENNNVPVSVRTPDKHLMVDILSCQTQSVVAMEKNKIYFPPMEILIASDNWVCPTTECVQQLSVSDNWVCPTTEWVHFMIWTRMRSRHMGYYSAIFLYNTTVFQLHSSTITTSGAIHTVHNCEIILS